MPTTIVSADPEPFVVNYLDAAGKPAVRRFADNAEAHAFRATLERDDKGGVPREAKAVEPQAPAKDDKPADAPKPAVTGPVSNGPKVDSANVAAPA